MPMSMLGNRVLVFGTVLLLATTCNALAKDNTQNNCKAAFKTHKQQYKNLNYTEFDQTENSGFRRLAMAGCFKEAADLIELYIKHHQSSENSLRWHVAQLRAMQGDYSEAIKSAERSLIDEDEAKKTKLLWNDYVQATLGFLRRDRSMWQRHRDRLAGAVESHPGNAMNLKLIDALGLHFDQTYAVATSRINAAASEK